MRSAHAFAAHSSFSALLRAPLGAGLAPRRLYRAENSRVRLVFSHVSVNIIFIDWCASFYRRPEGGLRRVLITTLASA
jgi:hypothetical protein